MLDDSIKKITAFAPASASNLAVGFDILGFAFDGLGDEVSVTRAKGQCLQIKSLDADMLIPVAVEKNTATIAIRALCDDLGIDSGFHVEVKKGIPLCSGLGGSAASAVAALVALNGFLSSPLSKSQLVKYALVAESIVSGGAHADNIVPCLWGSLVLIRQLEPLDVVELSCPKLHIILAHPNVEIPTKEARKLLSDSVSRDDWIAQSANLAGFISALYSGDFALLKRACNDIIIEPQRKVLLPGFDQIKSSAMNAGALACSFSGAGPTLFAFAQNDIDANNIKTQLDNGFKAQSLTSRSWVGELTHCPAHIVSKER